jgi:hypothetical protein
MALFIVVLGTRILNIQKRYSKLIIKCIAQKIMLKFGFGRKFHDLQFLKLDFFPIFLEFIINLRASSTTKFVEKHQLDVILSFFLKLNNYTFNISTCTLLALSSKICRLFVKNNSLV